MKILKTGCPSKVQMGGSNLSEEKLHSFPRSDGFRMPGEFEKQDGCLMIWPWRPGSWNYGAKAARTIFAQIAKKIAQGEQLYMMVRPEDMEEARAMLLGETKAKPSEEARAMLLGESAGEITETWNSSDTDSSANIHLIEALSEDAWARDTGATFVINDQGQRRGIDWEFNAWGGSYDGLYSHWENDQLIPEKICAFLGDRIYDAHPFVLEGGSIHVDGEGTLITTEECLLSPGRNPDLNKIEIEEKLKAYLNVKKIIWIPQGIYNDETNGHVDNICCFVKPGEVLLAWTDDENDPQYARSKVAYDILSHAVDAKGRKLMVHKLPIPKNPVCITEEDLLGYEFEDGEDMREVGERLAASYINFYIANHCVLLPKFGDEHDQLAVEILKNCFPEREIVPIDARVILTGGGNIHCITQQIPAKV